MGNGDPTLSLISMWTEISQRPIRLRQHTELVVRCDPNSYTVLIRPTLLVTRHRHPRREEISRTSRVPTSFEERDKKNSPAGRLNNTKKGDFWCRRDEFFVPSRVLLDFEEFPISSKASPVTWHEELVRTVQYLRCIHSGMR